MKSYYVMGLIVGTILGYNIKGTFSSKSNDLSYKIACLDGQISALEYAWQNKKLRTCDEMSKERH